MAEVKAFGGLRYSTKAGELARLVCPPYDIISEQQRMAYLAANSNNLIRLELPREGNDPYKQAGEVLSSWLDTGILAVDKQPAIYIYEEEFEAYGQRKTLKGINCLVKLEEFSQGVVLPHEETLSKAKQDRFNLMKACGCNFSPVYSLYFDEDANIYSAIDRLSQGKPDEEFTDEDGVIHRLWVVTDPQACADICSGFADKKLYIADGHHRYETALNYRRWLHEQGIEAPVGDYIMMTLVNMEHDGLVVFPTHRIIKDLPQFELKETLGRCEKYFEIKEKTCAIDAVMNYTDGTGSVLSDGSKGSSISFELGRRYDEGNISFALYAGGDSFFELTLRNKNQLAELLPEKSKAYCELDVAVLHSLVLEECFGIDKENMANQKNLVYTRDAQEAIDEVDSSKANCAFIINPTRVDQIAAVAAAGDKMPQKSTYFYPKIITGMVMNKIR